MKKKKKEDIEMKKQDKIKFKNNIQEHIKNNLNLIKINDNIDNKQEVHLNSWFNINLINNTYNSNNNLLFKNNLNNKKEIIKCQKIILLPTQEQKQIFNNWFEAYRLMYNKTIHYFNKQIYNKKEYNTSFQYIRTYILKQHKTALIQQFNTPSHLLDYAIKTACAMIKSALTNQQNGNIKYFRLRYLKTYKTSKIIDIEKTAFKKDNYIYKSYLKKSILNKSNFNYENINCDSKIHYNTLTDTYTLLIPIKKEVIEKVKIDNFISIDPGLRTFLTCIDNNNIIEIGTNVNNYLTNNINKINKYEDLKNNNNKKLTLQQIDNKIKKLKIKQINKIDDMQWKIISFLTSNYKNIVIGKWSTK